MWYTNWQNSEPNNWEGQDENCVEMYVRSQNSGGAGKWNDAICDDLLVRNMSYIFNVVLIKLFPNSH